MYLSKYVQFLAVFLISCHALGASPLSESRVKKKFQDWTLKLKNRYKEKFSSPTITHHVYLGKDGVECFLDLSGQYPRLTAEPCRGCLNKIIRRSMNQVDLVVLGKEKTQPLKMDHENKVPGLENIYLKPMIYEKDKTIRVFVHDLGQKELSKKKIRNFYPWRSAMIVDARFEWLATPREVTIQRSDGSSKNMKVVADIQYELNGKNGTLSVYDFGGSNYREEKVSMLLYRDYSNGKKTYGAGRFLDLEFPKKIKDLKSGDRVKIDFNYSYNPPCAVSTGFHCPLPLDMVKAEILAGEKYKK